MNASRRLVAEIFFVVARWTFIERAPRDCFTLVSG
jgi:hypothetical protein